MKAAAAFIAWMLILVIPTLVLLVVVVNAIEWLIDKGVL